MALWKDSNRLLKLLSKKMLDANQQATLVAQTKTLIDEWETLTPHQKITYLKLIFYKICVSRDGVDLHVSPNGMLACLTNEPQTKELPDKKDIVEVITVPIKLKRCGIEARLIVNNDMGQGPHAISVKAIQNALLKALQWHQGLVSGTITSTAEIAKTEGTAQRYVAVSLNLPFLHLILWKRSYEVISLLIALSLALEKVSQWIGPSKDKP